MSKLIAFVFDDPYKADEVRAALFRMEGEGLLEEDETAVISKKDAEKVRITQDTNIVSKRQQVGHIAGIIAANLTGTMPLILVGTVAGRLFGRFTDHGVTNSFINKVKKEVQPGTSALLICGQSDDAHRGKLIAKLRQWSPKVLESDMPPELAQEVNEALAKHGQAAASSASS